MLPKIDYRIEGLPHSTVEQQDHTRKEAVNKLIHQFATHPDREALKADLAESSVQPIQRKIEESDPQHGERGALQNMCEISSKIQCPHCFDIMDDRYLVLHMRSLPVSVSHTENVTNERGLIRYTSDSTLRVKERSTSWRASWKH